MKYQDIPEHILNKLYDAIITHDEALVTSERITNPGEPEIEIKADSMEFMLPFKMGDKRIMAKLKLEMEVV